MELDEMKTAWRQATDKLDRLAADYSDLRLQLGKSDAARSLRSTAAWVWADVVGSAITLVLLGLFLANQHAWRFIVPALILLPACIGTLASSLVQYAMLARVDFGDSVLAIQARLERFFLLRLRTLQFELLFACLLWLPLAIVLMRGVMGVDLYAAGTAWLIANAVFGVLAVPALWLLARYAGPWFGGTAVGCFLIEELTGRGLAAARRQMDALARFARE